MMRECVLTFVETIHRVFDEKQRRNGGGAVPIPYPEIYRAAVDAFEAEEEEGIDASSVFKKIVEVLHSENVFSELEKLLEVDG